MVTFDEKMTAKMRVRMLKKLEYHPDYCEKLVEHMSTGMSLESLRINNLHLPNSQLKKWIKDHEEFRWAYEVGLAASLHFWEGKGIGGLRDKDFKQAVWYANMKNRFNWRDKEDVTQQVEGKLSYDVVMDYIEGKDVD